MPFTAAHRRAPEPPRKTWPGSDARRYLEYDRFARAPWLTPAIAEIEYAIVIYRETARIDTDGMPCWPDVPDLIMPAPGFAESQRLASIEFQYAP